MKKAKQEKKLPRFIKSKPLLRFIVMCCGYVESSTTSVLIYQCGFFGNPGYTSYKEAITDLALDMYAKYSEAHKRARERRAKCCLQTLLAAKSANFCMFCRAPLHESRFDYQEFMDYVKGLHATICDSYGEAEGTKDRDMAWWPWGWEDFIGAPKEEVIYIAENAESILLMALLEAKPELANSEQDQDLVLHAADWEEFRVEKQPTYR